jgi:membrane protein YqaA with SNARE-associated domain
MKSQSQQNVKFKRYAAIIILALITIISIGGSIWLIKNYEYIKLLEKQGYIGLFVISLFAGSPIPIPTPNLILTFTMGSVLPPLLVALVSSFGNAIGNALIYITGRGGLEFFKNLGLTRRRKKSIRPTRMARVFYRFKVSKFNKFLGQHVLTAVFILGMYPNPLLLPVVAGMGAARYNFWKFFAVCWAGKFVEAVVLAYLGYYGLRSILHYFGIPVPVT